MNVLKNPAFYLCLLSVALAAVFLLIREGDILLNNPSEADYPIRGVDVSSYQGEIDWAVLSEGIDFAFVKATEGSSHTDERFEYNFNNAAKAGLSVGAYHFFSYDSSGKAQAEHFISTVPKAEDMLPPVIDVEFYGGNEKNPPAKADVLQELNVMADMLYQHYGVYPIIYATEKSYDLYIAGELPQCGIWIRAVLPTAEPRLSDGRKWLYWQYTDRYKPNGISGGVKFIDMNVLNPLIPYRG